MIQSNIKNVNSIIYFLNNIIIYDLFQLYSIINTLLMLFNVLNSQYTILLF